MSKTNKLCLCGSGKKTSECHSGITPNSIVANLLRTYLAIDSEIKSTSSFVNCGECNICCQSYFFVSEIEFFTILNYLMRDSIDILNIYLERSIIMLRKFKNDFPSEFYKLDTVYSENKFKNHTELLDDTNITSFGTCIFLNTHTGKCDIYAVRPIICRTYGCYRELTKGCIAIDIHNEELNKLLAYPKVDIIQNVDCFTYNGKTITRRAYPIFYWFAEIYLKYKNTSWFKEKYLLSYQATVNQFISAIANKNNL